MNKAVNTIFCAVFTAGTLAGADSGWRSLINLDYKLDHYVPTTATILSSQVEEEVVQGMTTDYYAGIAYSISYQGKNYVAGGVNPAGASTSESTAKDLVRRFPVGRTFAAWCNPQDPADAFLVRDLPVFPTLLILSSAIGLMLSFHLWTTVAINPTYLPASGADSGMLELMPNRRLGRQWGILLLATFCWAAATHWPAIDAIRRGNIGAMTYGLIVFCAGGDVWLAVLIGRFIRLRRRIRTPRVLIDSAKPRSGEFIRVKVKQTAFERGLTCWVGLMCEKLRGASGEGMKITTEYEEFEQLNPEWNGSEIEMSAILRIPGELPPTTTPMGYRRPGYKWKIVVAEKLQNGQDYRVGFPLHVRG